MGISTLACRKLRVVGTNANRLPSRFPVTRDGRYFVVRGQLWRCANPDLDDEVRCDLVQELAAARRAVRSALSGRGDLVAARQQVAAAKEALGERGPVWWRDGAPDYTRQMVADTPYAEWFLAQAA